MDMGIPTPMSVLDGEAISIIQEAKSGVVVESENVGQIAEAILKLKNDEEKYVT